MQVIEKIIDERLGFPMLVHHCNRCFSGKLTFQFYDSIRGSHTVISDNCDKIESYIFSALLGNIQYILQCLGMQFIYMKVRL